MENIRKETIKKFKKHKLDINQQIGFYDIKKLKLCSEVMVIERVLCLGFVIGTSYSPDKLEVGLSWIRDQKLLSALTQKELSLTSSKFPDYLYFNYQYEGAYVLLWALSFYKTVNFLKNSPDSLIDHYPSVKSNEPKDFFIEKSRLRMFDDIIAIYDFYLCLANSVKENPRKKFDCIMINERIRAVRWLLGTKEWDDHLLDPTKIVW